jgi:hypothetical protein
MSKNNSATKIDPESFWGKATLLAFDKLVLGAVIAIAFASYQASQRAEQQAHDDAFKHAQYLHDLLPIIADPSKNTVERSELLGALISTDSIDSQTAISITHQILSQRPDSTGHQYPHSEENVLSEKLLARMPGALNTMLTQYSSHFGERVYGEAAPPDPASAFWGDLFVHTVDASTDKELGELSDPLFLSLHLFAMSSLTDARTVTSNDTDSCQRRWFGRGVQGLRILGATCIIMNAGAGGVSVSHNKDTPMSAAAEGYLVELIDPTQCTPQSADLSFDVLELLRHQRLAIDSVFLRCANIVQSYEHPVGQGYDVLGLRYQAAEAYLKFYPHVGSLAVVGRAVEPPLRTLLSRVQKQPPTGLSKGEVAAIWSLVATLVAAIESHPVDTSPPAASARLLLRDVYSLPEETVAALGLGIQRPSWLDQGFRAAGAKKQ